MNVHLSATGRLDVGMTPSVIEEVRLTAFKSYSGAVLPMDAMTLLVGRNGSGKSNALDGLWVLSKLAQGDDIRDTLDGGREGPSVRGGVVGCAPFGQSRFELGCRVTTGLEAVEYDVAVQVEPVVQVVKESIRVDGQTVLQTMAPTFDSADITAIWDSPTEREVLFRAGRLLSTQVLARIPATTQGQRLHLAAARILAALRDVFVLDPVPATMRGYVPRRDSLLRRDADNLSAAVGALLEDPATAGVLSSALSQLNEQEVVDVTTSRSDLDDVMLTLVERFAGQDMQVPARVMSDGTLRFLAILVSLLQAPTVDTLPERLASEDALGQTTLVVEELENGLHASQAQLLLSLIRDEVRSRRVRVLATAHSPALLDALTGEEHRSVVVCQRDAKGRSTLHRLSDLPNYVDVVAAGGLGRAVERDRLRRQERPIRRASEALAEILGGDQQ